MSPGNFLMALGRRGVVLTSDIPLKMNCLLKALLVAVIWVRGSYTMPFLGTR